MTSYTSPYTGNTSYTSDCGLFASMNEGLVEEFEKTDITSKFDFNWKSSLKWSFAGNCPIADEYRHDISTGSVLQREAEIDYQKSSKYGKNCNPFRQRDAGKLAKDNYLKSKGYKVS